MSNIFNNHSFFSNNLINWYSTKKRSLPWRETKNPYNIWLSEIILQQTKVEQGLPYFEKFIVEFPTVFDLAKANEDRVLKLWQGLGYYSRARNLHHTAKFVAEQLGGVFPNNSNELKKLKGIGEYTAAAIGSFSYDEKVAVVDGNVYRVLSRVFGIETPIDSSLGKKQFKELANLLISEKEPATFNQAIMEFGALQCVPKNPICTNCPLENKCFALQNNVINSLPKKEKKTKQRKRYINYLVFINNQSILFKKRTSKGIWQNLHDFPSIENKKALTKEEVNKQARKLYNLPLNIEHELVMDKHILSHQILFCTFFIIKTTKNIDLKEDEFYIQLNEIENLAVPKLIENYLHKISKLLSLFANN